MKRSAALWTALENGTAFVDFDARTVKITAPNSAFGRTSCLPYSNSWSHCSSPPTMHGARRELTFTRSPPLLLLCGVRAAISQTSQLVRAEFVTIRERLLKIGGRFIEHIARIPHPAAHELPDAACVPDQALQKGLVHACDIKC